MPTIAQTRQQLRGLARHSADLVRRSADLVRTLEGLHDSTLAKLLSASRHSSSLREELSRRGLALFSAALAEPSEQASRIAGASQEALRAMGPPERADSRRVVRGSPERELAVHCLELFEAHRGRSSAHAGEDSDYVELCALAFEIATGERRSLRRVAADLVQEWRRRLVAWGEIPPARPARRRPAK
jgi:hypothetical protein